MCTPETRTATLLALGDRFKNSTHHSNQPLANWLALKTAMHWPVDAPTTNATLPTASLTLTRNVAAYVRRHGMTQTQRWMSWPTNTERTLKLGAATLRNSQQQDAGQAPTGGGALKGG